MRAWRRDLDTLVGVPSASDALLVSVERDAVALQISGVRGGAGGTGRVTRLAARAPLVLPMADGSVGALTLWLLGERGAAEVRAALLGELARVCAPGGVLVAVDHNRPRRRWAALRAVVAAPRPAGGTPAARWRRLAYPTAREIRAAGFVIERLRLAAGERVQVVWGRRSRSTRNEASRE
jgi:SAM-dependent methyltransferase